MVKKFDELPKDEQSDVIIQAIQSGQFDDNLQEILAVVAYREANSGNVVLTQQEASDLLWSFYDLVFAVDNCKNFEDLEQWVHLDLKVLNPICIGNIEHAIGCTIGTPVKVPAEYGELVNKVIKRDNQCVECDPQDIESCADCARDSGFGGFVD